MLGKWDHSRFKSPERYGDDDVTYRLGMEFLDDCEIVEDWGCGTGFSRAYRRGRAWVGIDGSRSPFADKILDLRHYRSDADGIFMRHVLEHNHDWRRILQNAVASARRRISLVVFTPFSAETRQIAVNWSDIPDLSFRKEDLLECFDGLSVVERTLETRTQYRTETVFLLARPTPS